MPDSSSDRTLPASLGPFRLIKQLGQGGFAPVWHAEEIYGGRKLRDVAIKLFFLPEEIEADSAEAAEWLYGVMDEARALCRVEHPNVVRFYTLHRDDTSGVVGLVMEHVVGKNLSEVLSQGGPFKARSVLEVGISVAWALAAVHNAGLVHRDVKPGNIMKAASGYKLIDFGIVVDAPPSSRVAARLHESPPPPRVIGTPPYIAPEYIERGAPPSPAGDVYALGMTLFMLATGSFPRVARRWLLQSGRAPSQPVRFESPDPQERSATDAILTMIAPLLDPDPHARPRHADWVARELERLQARLGNPAAPGPVVFSAQALPDWPSATVESPITRALLDFDRRVPAPLSPLFDEVRRALEGDRSTDVGAALGEVGLGLLRYAFAVGMALLAASATAPLPDALAEQLRSAGRFSNASWCSLLRALHEALETIKPSSAHLFSFAADASLVHRLDALVHDTDGATADGLWAQPLLDLLEGAAELLAIPLDSPGADGATRQVGGRRGAARDRSLRIEPATDKEPCALLGERRIPLSPWLPRDGLRLLLPEAPAAPGRPWRSVDPVSGERCDDPRLDEAVRHLLGGGEEGQGRPLELRPCPPLVGRAQTLALLKRAAREAAEGSMRIVLLTGPLGVGRTRLLDAAVEQADVARARVLRALCSPERQSPLKPLLAGLDALPQGGEDVFSLLKRAIAQALAPRVLPAVVPGAHQQSSEALEAIEDALLRAAAEAPVLLVIDDIQWGDALTLQLLQLLIERARLGSRAKLLVLAAARNEPNASASLRAFLGAAQARPCPGIKHLALGPLTDEQAAAMAHAVCPLEPALRQAVVRGSGGVPFFLVNALLVWRETGMITWQKGAWRAADERVLREDVPGVAALVETRLASYFAPNSPLWRAALRALAAVAVHGGGLPIETIFRVGGDEESVEVALEALVEAGILVVSGEQQAYGFAQEMVRQAVLNLVRQRPWFYRLHRALLDTLAQGPDAAEDAAFLAAGYEKLGDRDQARAWLGRAMEGAIQRGLFAAAAAFGDRLAALAPDAATRADVELAIVRALVQGRQLEDAKARLDAGAGGRADEGPRAAALDVRRRILRLEVARGRFEAADDPTLLADADALSDPALGCEARMALAGVAPEEQALKLADEAVARAERCSPALEFSARVLRFELAYVAVRDLQQAERDLRRAVSIAAATSSSWQQIHIEGDLAVLEAERDLAAAIERLRRLSGQAETWGMRGQLRLLTQNLATCLMRQGRTAEAAEVAQRTAELAAEAGDPFLRGTALSLRAYALLCTGDLDAALTSATEAEWLQRERNDRMRAQTLLRRAEILDAMGREVEALEDARAAQEVAEIHGNKAFLVTAVLWEKLYLARRGKAPLEELQAAVAAAEASGAGKRALTRHLIEQAAAWLASATSPMTS